MPRSLRNPNPTLSRSPNPLRREILALAPKTQLGRDRFQSEFGLRDFGFRIRSQVRDGGKLNRLQIRLKGS